MGPSISNPPVKGYTLTPLWRRSITYPPVNGLSPFDPPVEELSNFFPRELVFSIWPPVKGISNFFPREGTTSSTPLWRGVRGVASLCKGGADEVSGGLTIELKLPASLRKGDVPKGRWVDRIIKNKLFISVYNCCVDEVSGGLIKEIKNCTCGELYNKEIKN